MADHYYQFEHFDPLTGRLPDPFEVEYVEILYRARQLLIDFTSDEIKLAISELNLFHKHPNYKSVFHDIAKRPTIEILDEGQKLEIVVSDNSIQAFYSNIKNVSLNDFSELSKFSWSQVFAIMTIYYAEFIATSIYAIENWKEKSPFQKPTIETVLKKAKQNLIEASQALAYAEVLNDQKYLFEVLKTEKARKASIKRNRDKYSPLQAKIKSVLKEFYEKDSARSASNKIYERLIKDELIFFDANTNRLTFEGKLVLQTDDPVKQFEKWIGKIKKSAM